MRNIRQLEQSRNTFRLRSQFAVDVTADLRHLPYERAEWPLYPCEHLRPSTLLLEVLPSVFFVNLMGCRAEVTQSHNSNPIWLTPLSLCPLSAPPDSKIPGYRIREAEGPRGLSAVPWNLKIRLTVGRQARPDGWVDIWTPFTPIIGLDRLLSKAMDNKPAISQYPFVTHEGETLAAMNISALRNGTTGQVFILAEDCTGSPITVLNALRSVGCVLIPSQEPFMEPPTSNTQKSSDPMALPMIVQAASQTDPQQSKSPEDPSRDNDTVAAPSPAIVPMPKVSTAPKTFHYIAPNTAAPFFPPPASRAAEEPNRLIAEFVLVPSVGGRQTALEKARLIKPHQALITQPRYRIQCEWPRRQDWLSCERLRTDGELLRQDVMAIFPNSALRGLLASIGGAMRQCAR